MELEFRLKELLEQVGLDRHGVLKRMATDLEIHRQTVSRIYHNQKKTVSLDVLSKICGWLVENKVPPEKLPQGLLGSHPTLLWQALARCRHVRFCIGEYLEAVPDAPTRQWVSRRDFALTAEIVQALSTPTDRGDVPPTFYFEFVPFHAGPREARHRRETPAGDLAQDTQRAQQVFAELKTHAAHSSIVLIGSPRANPAVELLIADLFHAKPWQLDPTRRVPFHLGFHEYSRPVPSCCADLQKPAGIYFRSDPQHWEYFPSERDRRDAGLILCVYDPGTKAVQMAVFGYSGQGTEALGRELLRDASPFWPPRVTTRSGAHLGIYVCSFGLRVDAAGAVHPADFTHRELTRDVLKGALG